MPDGEEDERGAKHERQHVAESSEGESHGEGSPEPPAERRAPAPPTPAEAELLAFRYNQGRKKNPSDPGGTLHLLYEGERERSGPSRALPSPVRAVEPPAGGGFGTGPSTGGAGSSVTTACF